MITRGFLRLLVYVSGRPRSMRAHKAHAHKGGIAELTHCFDCPSIVLL